LAVLSSIVTYVAAHSAGAVHSKAIPSVVRIGNAFVSYIAYMEKMIWPSNLAVYYPYPEVLILWQVLGSVLLLIAITLAVFKMVKRFPYLATGWLWYLSTLVPVIGIVQAGSQAMADRYTYIPLIGLFTMVAWSFPDLLKKWHYRKEILFTLSILIILCLSIKTWTQVGYWQNSMTLNEHALKVTDNNWLIYNGRGNANYTLGNYRQAIEDYDRAIEINPDFLDAHNNRGDAYIGLGNYRQAIEDYNRAIEIKPAYADAYSNRGLSYSKLGQYQLAIEDFNKLIRLKPAYADAYYSRGNAYGMLGQYQLAIEDFNKVISLKPAYTMVYLNRGAAYARLGNNDLAIDDLKTAAKLGDERARNFLISHGISW
jgi:tetratricopeptide (TPR) repeat protein